MRFLPRGAAGEGREKTAIPELGNQGKEENKGDAAHFARRRSIPVQVCAGLLPSNIDKVGRVDTPAYYITSRAFIVSDDVTLATDGAGVTTLTAFDKDGNVTHGPERLHDDRAL